MHLQEMLKELRVNILHDRSDSVPGGSSDQLWDDETLIRYINDAVDRFANETECIRDFVTPEATQVTLVPGQEFYPLHTSVIGVMSARYGSDQADLARAGHSTLSTYQAPVTPYFDPNQMDVLHPGKPRAFATDEGVTESEHGSFMVCNLRIYPVPAAGYTDLVKLRVVRRPLRHMSAPTDRPEIPSNWHLAVLDWAGYLAIRQPDLDIAGMDQMLKMRELKSQFDDHCVRAKKQLTRKTFAPATWGFGRGGGTYVRDYN
jgi:hypothetical protein